MPVQTVQYHWAMSPSFVINPHIFTTYSTQVLLPEHATLRRILVAETLFYWKRASVSFDDQQAYFVNAQVLYGNALGAPVLYRTTKRVPEVICVQDPAVTDVFCSIHSAADAEMQINEKVQRGGWDAGPIPVILNWAIYSSGHGDEELSGQAAMPFRVLYSVPVPP